MWIRCLKAIVWFDVVSGPSADFELRGEAEQALRTAVSHSDYWTAVPRTKIVTATQNTGMNRRV